MRPIIVVALALLAAICPAPALAAQPAGQSVAIADSGVAAQVEKALAATGLKLTRQLDAPAGYQGFVGTYRGQSLPVYVTPDGKHVIIGTLYDMQGNDLTEPAMQKVADAAFGPTQWSMLEKATWVSEGNPKARRVVYAFVDTRCPYCEEFWKASQQWLAKGQVQVRNILVAVVTPQSLPEAAAIVDSHDPTSAWQANERNFGKPSQASGDDKPSSAAFQKILANNRLMDLLGLHGTPAVLYKDNAGKIHVLRGMPRNRGVLRDVFGG